MEPVPCVGAVIRDGDGRFLLVRRGRDPDRGRWSVPGGKIEPGESDVAACAREVLEETGLRVEVGAYVGSVERSGPGGVVYDVRDYLCTAAPGADPADVRAGDDAAEVGWFTPAELRAADTVRLLVETLEGWQLLD
ncbi:MAG: NUDIX hydrolase [Nocardioides sp.]